MVFFRTLYFLAILDAPWRSLSDDNLGKTGDQEIIRKSLDSSGRQLGPLATQWTSELPVIRILLVRRLGNDVAFNAVLTERVEAGQTLGPLVRFQTDLADEKLVIDLLG